ncbi:MAG: hypothetical protein RL701_1585 [Pseudomonadota bacterium]|jgi:signal transduction histidine kinase
MTELSSLSSLSTQRLLRFARSLQRAEDFAQLVRAASLEVQEALGYAHTWLMIAEDETLMRFRMIAYAGSQSDRVWEVAPVLEVSGDAFLMALIASDGPDVVVDARLDPRTHKPTVEALQNRTLINVPMRLFDKPLGFLGVGTFGDEGCRAPTPAQVDFLVGIASQLTVAAARVRYAQERARAELEKRALERRIEQMQRLESLGLLAGGIAHDFNNLLTVIMSSVTLAQKSVRDPIVSDDLGAALTATHRARDLTAQLLAMSRSQPLSLHALDINAHIVQLTTLLQRIFPESVVLELKLGADLPRIEADRSQIDQVFMNLCINARDAMPAGGRLTVETEWTHVSASFVEVHPWARPGQYVLATVSDNGVGMAKDVLDRVFEPFFTTKASVGGTGLGLAVAYGIVTQHGGLLHAYSEPGVGTTFKVYLPIGKRDAKSVIPRGNPVVGRGFERLLLAEDDDAVRGITQRILERAGYSVTCVVSGDAAVSCAGELSFDLIVLDVVMPGMACEDAVAHLLRTQPHARILLASGYTAGSQVLDLVNTQHLRLLRKPYDPDELLSAVREALDAPPLS